MTMKMWQLSFWLWHRAWFPALLLLIWQTISRFFDNPFVPTPLEVVQASRETISLEWIQNNLAPSLITILVGYLGGSSLGFLCGLVLGISERIRRIFLPVGNFLRAIPSVAKVPVLIALFGLGSLTRIATVAVAVFFIVMLSTIDGLGKTKEEHRDLALWIKLSPIRTVLSIRIPSALDDILIGLHVALQIAVLVMIVSEMLGSGFGVGAFIFQSQATFYVTGMWVGIMVIGFIGVALNATFLFWEKKLFSWRDRAGIVL